MVRDEEYVFFEGTGAKMESFWANYFDQTGVALVQRNLGIIHDALNKTEHFDIKHTDDSSMNLVMMDGEYFLSVRKTTIALVGLILDITFTKGFATFVLGLFGFHADQIRKLNYEEKRILLLIQADKIWFDHARNEYNKAIDDEIDYEFPPETIKTIINGLIDKGIVVRKDNRLKVAF